MRSQMSSSSKTLVKCLVLPWSTEPPSEATAATGHQQQHRPPPCQLALVSDCTHFQEFHAHLFLTMAYRVRVDGRVFMCQPHRGQSLTSFLDLIRVTAAADDDDDTRCGPLFSVEWLPIDGIPTAAGSGVDNEHYDPNIHRPHWIMLRKLREVDPKDRQNILQHMKDRDKVGAAVHG